MNVFSVLQSKSIRVRFISTLVANIIRFTLNFLTGMFIARALGPGEFGNFNFLLTAFLSISQLIDMGTSTAFYTFISRKRRPAAFYGYYIGWMAVQFAVALLLATVLLPEFLRQKIWLGHGMGKVVLSLLASFSMNQLWQVVSQAGESIRATVTVQAYNIALSAVYVLTVLFMIRFGLISVSGLYVVITLQYVLFALLLARRLRVELVEKGGAVAGETLKFAAVFDEFKVYCAPLIGYSVVNFLYIFLDNWLLQRFAGPVEQGYYAAGYRFTFLSSIALASMLQVLWKEVAEALERHDLDRVRELARKTTRVLYFSTAVISCFLVPFSREMLVWLVGSSYEGAWLCMAVMLFYPLIQAAGQVSNTILLAGGHTVLYRNLGIAFMLVSIPVTYFVLATPRGAYFGLPGLGLGATGLALKLVVLNYIGTNVIVYVVSRLYRWKFDFWYQFESISLLLGAAYASKYFVSWLLGALLPAVSTPTLLMGSVLIYSMGLAFIVYILPGLTGFEGEEMKSMFLKARALLMLKNEKD